MAALSLGPEFEEAIIAAAGIGHLNLDPGSMRIDLINVPETTVRFTLVVTVPGEAVKAAVEAAVSSAFTAAVDAATVFNTIE